MAMEVEHKFLVIDDTWREQVKRSQLFRQGYLNNNPHASVRIRIEGEQANLNIKGMTIGIQRLEYEYPIPLNDAQALLDKLCVGPIIDKTRHFIEVGQHLWEVDEFHGDNAGLIVAEVELAEAGETFIKPTWAGADVSGITRYYNVSLLKYPYSIWSDGERQALDV